MPTDISAVMAARAARNGRAISESEVGELLRDIATHEYPSLRAMARAWKVSPAYLSNAIRGKTPPGPALLAHLGLERAPATYRRKDGAHV